METSSLAGTSSPPFFCHTIHTMDSPLCYVSSVAGTTMSSLGLEVLSCSIDHIPVCCPTLAPSFPSLDEDSLDTRGRSRYYLPSSSRLPYISASSQILMIKLGALYPSKIPKIPRGCQSLISKAIHKASHDILVGRKLSLDGVLRVNKTLKYGPLMKWISLNCRGLASNSKKLALKLLMSSDKIDIIFLQETLGNSVNIINTLEGMFKDWDFFAVDGRGRFGGLTLGVNCKSIKILNT